MDKLTKSGNIKKGQVLNPNGRPVGSVAKVNSNDIKTRLQARHKVHPADRLVTLAGALEAAGKLDEAAKIWMTLLKYCESPKKQAAAEKEPEKTPALSSEDADKLLEAFENNGRNPVKSDQGNGVAEGPVDVPSETSTEADLPGDPVE